METAKNEEGLNEVLVEELMGGIQVESLVEEGLFSSKKGQQKEKDSPVKKYKTIAGLNNVGKTFFCSGDEIEQKRQWVEAQMAQKYGAEIYGASAQLKTQSANEASQQGDGTGTGTGDVVDRGGSLIKCSVNPLMDLKQLNESGGSFDDFYNNLKTIVDNYLSAGGEENGDWLKKFNKSEGPSGKTNKQSWLELEKMFKETKWQKEYKNNNKFKKSLDNLIKSWREWGGTTGSDGEKGGKGGDHLGGGSSVSGSSWERYQSWRIDVQTNFNEQWFKRKFKSGFLNKAIMAAKTGLSKQDAKNSDMYDHKYTGDEMLSQDTRKLDSIQWKMTNKVAKDFVSLLLGWSRKKEYIMESGMPVPAQEKLNQDAGFGKTMAKKALGGRGILGRLKQKLFSGGQSNNVISIAFQMADWLDGWTDVTEKQKKDNDNGGQEETGGNNTGTENSSETKPPKEAEQDEVEQTNESIQVYPFADVFMEGWDSDIDLTRHELVVEACEEKEGSVDKLIDDCLIG